MAPVSCRVNSAYMPRSRTRFRRGPDANLLALVHQAQQAALPSQEGQTPINEKYLARIASLELE
jgi:hypothetical protein